VQQITNDQNSALVEYTVVDGLLAWEHYDLVSGVTDIFIYNGSQVINLTNTADISETMISRGLTDRLYWESAAGRFTYVNGQVQRVDTGEGNYSIVTSRNGNLLLEGYQLSEDQSFSGVYQGTHFDSAKIKRGTANSDRLIGNLTSNIIYGLNGNDTLVGGSGTDNLYGGNGNDDIEGKGGNDLIFGGDGNDRLSGGAGVDVLVGGAGDDRLTGGTGNDKLFGGLGNNKIEGGDGSDYIESGAGNDKIDGGQGNDTIFGGLGIDTIHGGSGNDSITADAGRIYGDGGDDYLTGGEQSILIEGGSGNDTIVGETGFFSSPTVFGAKLSGDGGDDNITGRFGNDTISGGTGNDSIQGQDGNDRIAGDQGNDILIGDAGSDYLEGGQGNDQLTGGLGNDTLNGGAGSDTFVFSSFGPFFDRELGVDKISDFSVAIDKIQLQYNALTPELSFAVVARDINVDTSSAAIVYSQGSGTLFYNGNGAEAGLDNGGAFAILTNRPQNLTANNFIVV
jgi:Ca2+-binding RTX toxin-like protein